MTRDQGLGVLSAAFGVLLCQLALSLALIPPWQQPDEHAQVAVAEVFRDRLTSLGSADPGRQREILQSMAAYDWWGHYRSATPTPLPARFLEGGGAAITIGVDPTSPDYPRTYYAIIAGLLSLVPLMAVVKDLYVMRAFSAALALLTLWVAWRGSRECLGELGGATVAVLLALHPQFAVVSTTASPDALVNFLGACLWWQALRAVRAENVLWPIVGMWAAAFVATTADRMGEPLLLSAFAVSAIVVARRIGLKRSIVALAVGFAAVLGTSSWLLDRFGLTLSSAEFLRMIPVPDARSWDYFFRFTSIFFESWWSTLGWMRYTPPSWWMSIAVVCAMGALLGVILLFFRSDDTLKGDGFRLAVMMLAIQTAGIYWTYFRVADSSQGRHLFPFLIPALTIFWVGIEALTPMRYRAYAVIGVVAIFALLDITVWELVAIPTYTT